MFTLKEKQYLLQLLKASRRWSWFGLRKPAPLHADLIAKLEQMIRNEQTNRDHL